VIDTTSVATAVVIAELLGAHATGDPADTIAFETYGDHWVMWDTENDPAEYLYLFMPGSGQLPEVRCEWVLEGAAHAGLRGIALAYQNNGSISDLCADSKDSDCMESARLERIYGVDTSDLIDCPPEESVVGLLKSLLNELHEMHPDMGWLRWLDDDMEPRWEQIVVAGHSQGAGNAAFIARDHLVARVVMYGGPFDRDQTSEVDIEQRLYTPAAWLLDATTTPSRRYFAFYHVRDNKPYTFILQANLHLLMDPTTATAVDVERIPGMDPTGFRFLTTTKPLHPLQSPHTYPMLERFAGIHTYLAEPHN
jgi:hypothetical protein